MPQSLSTNTFVTTQVIVSQDPTQGSYTSIQAAIDSGFAKVIFIREGIYTENITLTVYTNLVAYSTDGEEPNVTIVGTVSYSGVDVATISGIRLQTNGSFCVSVTGNAPSVLKFFNCYINCTNFTGINHSSTSSSSALVFRNCSGDITNPGITFFQSTSNGNLIFEHSTFKNSGGSATASTINSAQAYIDWSEIYFPIVGGAASGIGSQSTKFVANNTTCVTYTGSLVNSVTNCSFSSGTASCVSVGVGATLNIGGAQTTSTNANVITGAGAVKYGFVGFGTSVEKTVNTTTQSGLSSGTWTPVLSFGGGSVGIVYATQTGSYTRFGSVVFFDLIVNVSNKGSSAGALEITLPFAPSFNSPVNTLFTGVTFPSNVWTQIIGAKITLDHSVSGSASTQITNASCAVSISFYITGNYLAL